MSDTSKLYLNCVRYVRTLYIYVLTYFLWIHKPCRLLH